MLSTSLVVFLATTFLSASSRVTVMTRLKASSIILVRYPLESRSPFNSSSLILKTMVFLKQWHESRSWDLGDGLGLSALGIPKCPRWLKA